VAAGKTTPRTLLQASAVGPVNRTFKQQCKKISSTALS